MLLMRPLELIEYGSRHSATEFHVCVYGSSLGTPEDTGGTRLDAIYGGISIIFMANRNFTNKNGSNKNLRKR